MPTCASRGFHTLCRKLSSLDVTQFNVHPFAQCLYDEPGSGGLDVVTGAVAYANSVHAVSVTVDSEADCVHQSRRVWRVVSDDVQGRRVCHAWHVAIRSAVHGPHVRGFRPRTRWTRAKRRRLRAHPTSLRSPLRRQD
uniref:Uncharacterized protein n=1 Tax=Rhipicephalus microplus TaxID=6941 RepID=A0A6G5AIQ3_RHIMP